MTTTSNNSHQSIDVQHAKFSITGMNCAACARRLEKNLNEKSQIVTVTVNFASETTNIAYNPSQTSITEIQDWITQAGFSGTHQASLMPTAPEHKTTPPKSLIWLWILTLPFLVGMLGMMVGSHALMPPVWVQFILATIVQFGFALPFYRRALSALRMGSANMDTLIVLSTTAVWLYSTYMWLSTHDAHHASHHAHVYFESSVMVIAFVSLGKYLEARTKQNSLNSLSLLIDFVPKFAQLKASDGFRRVSVQNIRPDDIIVARTGDRIAIDGVVTHGTGYCNESHLTGESQSVKKNVGDIVLSGALVSDGTLEYQVTTSANKSKIMQMLAALQEAQDSKADISRLADRISSIFVPIVTLISIATFLINYVWLGEFEVALLRAVAVLVIACPCALGLATPAAIMAGMGVAARHGIWFKDATSLETAGGVNAICFDKTGTLTNGSPSIIAHAMPDGKMAYDELLVISAAIEQYSNHPFASTIVKAAKEKELTLPQAHNVTTVMGEGIQGELDDGRVVKVGNPNFANYPTDLISQEGIWHNASLVAVAIDDKPVLLLALADDIKTDAQHLIDRLKQLNLKLVMLSGDKSSTVHHVANLLGIEAFSDLSSTDKVNKIKELQKIHKVAMVGDGINDAAAMAQADASFAVDRATDIAAHTASARLTKESLLQVYKAHIIANKTLRNIRQNLLFSFIYNLVGIPLAMFGLLNPIIAALMMALSSLCVLMNALRLSKFKLK